MTVKKTIDKSLIQKTIVFAFWLVIILICLINRDKITVDAIVNFTPGNKWAAALVIWLLFAFKSISVVVYGGLIYAASGIMFSLPVAIIVNTVGTALMVSIPFFIGKKAGNGTINKIVEKNPKLEVLRSVPNKNELFISFFVRLLGILPSDLVSMYLGLMQYAVRTEKLSDAAQICCKEADPLLEEVVPYVQNRFNVLHRLILKRVCRRRFRCAALGMKAYSIVHKLLKR